MSAEDLQLLRKGLWPLSMVYGLVISFRNLLFDWQWRAVHRVSVPVVSVGNLAAGGTGKTPLVAWLVGKALARGLRPGVLARGYGRGPGQRLNDEGELLARRFPGLSQVQDADRVRGARRLVADMEVDLIILDDGFQHRRLHRDRDLVCVDAARPFAGGMLPVGYLREGPKALRRADGLVLTRAGELTAEAVAERKQRLGAYGRETLRVFAADHVPSRLVAMPNGADVGLDALQGRRVVLLSAIARPDSFVATVVALGAEVVGHLARRDHHRHTRAELSDARRRAEAEGAVLVTTEKDDVKLVGMETPRLVLHLELQFLGEEPDLAWLFEAGPTP